MSNTWTCPFCHQPQPLTNPMYYRSAHELDVVSSFGTVGYVIEATSCANQACREVELTIRFGSGEWKNLIGRPNQFVLEDGAERYKLRPQSSAKPLPAYIPTGLQEDYKEACAIRDLSPKASATLSRRCLQGMIRNFCGIQEPTLFQEINALKNAVDNGNAPKGVDPESMDAIDHVRGIGNIGAHMEKDIDVIIGVDAGEADALIQLLEMLFDDWYVARNKREARLAKVQQIGEAKADEKKQAKGKPVDSNKKPAA